VLDQQPDQREALMGAALIALPSSTALDLAAAYERRTFLYDGWRDQLVERLAPRRGETVLE